MIKSDKGHTTIEGNRIDLIFEFVTLYKQAINVIPEVVTQTVLAYEDELKSAYEKCPMGECIIAEQFVKSAKETIKNE